MKKIDLSAVSTSIGFPFKHGTMDHLQSAYQEAIAALAQNVIGDSYDPALFYILWGCKGAGTDPGARTISAGAIFFNGEIYLVDAASFTTTGSDVAVGTIAVTSYSPVDNSADPVAFTDGVNRSVHQIRKIVFAAGASASGDVDFTDVLTNSWIFDNDVSHVNASVTNMHITAIAIYCLIKSGIVYVTGVVDFTPTSNIASSGFEYFPPITTKVGPGNAYFPVVLQGPTVGVSDVAANGYTHNGGGGVASVKVDGPAVTSGTASRFAFNFFFGFN